jgi:hypothetical protein
MHLRFMTAALAASMLVSAAPDSFAADKAPKPPAGLMDTFKGCIWGEVKGATLSIWSLACGPKAGDMRLVADNSLPGFVLETNGPDGKSRKVLIRAFSKEAKAPITAALPAIRAASPGASSASCALVPFDDADNRRFARGAPVFTFEPTGAAKVAWDKAEKEGGDHPAPCGDLGIYFDRAPIFWIMRDDPTTVIAADMGSEIQIFDPTTLRRTK